jgi:hypothetical protein
MECGEGVMAECDKLWPLVLLSGSMGLMFGFVFALVVSMRAATKPTKPIYMIVGPEDIDHG